jgi:outer membrane biosynthesis protein TonB
MHDQNQHWISRTLAFIVSVGLHAALIVVVLGMTQRPLEPKEHIKVELVNLSALPGELGLSQPGPAASEPASPEPPQPEPPSPEPPQPEPPQPEPPQPEPPKPEPPKPEPPKPEPPKPEPPKPPAPKPKVIAAPEPTPKPTPPKPTPKPEPKPSKPIKSIKERLQEAEVKRLPSRPTQRSGRRNATSKEELQKKLLRAAGESATSGSGSIVPSGKTSYYTAQQLKESSNYAEKVVSPYLYQRWEQPTRSELGSTPVRPVEVSFTVYANGAIANVVIDAGANNNQVLVHSIRNLFAGIRSMPPLSTVGSNASSLRIIVTMTLTSD